MNSPSPLSSNFRVPAAPDTNLQFYVQGAGELPVSAEHIARGVLAGQLAQGAFVAPVGSPSWVPLEAVPALAAAIEQAKAEEAKRSLSPNAPPVSIIPPPMQQPLPMQPIPTLAPPPVSAFTPAAPEAPKELEAPKEPAVAKEPAKEEPKKLDPRYKVLPVAIFGGFAALGALETIVWLIAR
jgi:hypothetical protein